jgi:hypothetical protein
MSAIVGTKSGVGAESSRTGSGRVTGFWVRSIAGGGRSSHIPTPGGAMEGVGRESLGVCS